MTIKHTNIALIEKTYGEINQKRNKKGTIEMLEKLVRETTLPKAYHKALVELNTNGNIVPCPDYNTTQKEISATIVVSAPLQEPMISRLFPGDPRSLEQYRQEILYGILDFEIEKGNWHYTYHNRIADQIPLVIEELRRNPYSRRAVLNARRNDEDWATESPACLQHIQFFIRDSKFCREKILDCIVLFRSNDAVKAAFMNAFALIMLQKSIADELGVGVGTYTHRANSFHVYEKDFVTLQAYTNRILGVNSNLFYNYLGEWDELMDDEKPGIAKMVEELKARNAH
jgi:thymidylate synthase